METGNANDETLIDRRLGSEAATSDSDSTISFEYLRRRNKYALGLHLVQGILMLVSSQSVPGVKDFTKPLVTSFLVYDQATQALVSESKEVGSVAIAAWTSSFLLMSAVAHAYILYNFNDYQANVTNGINPARWYEYAISSSVMICLIAMLFGCYDLGSLLLIFFINAVMNMSGLLMEQMNPPTRKVTRWSPFIIGCIAGAAPWIVILMYFLGSGNFSEIPGFVYGILVAYLIFFNTFPINMWLQYARYGKWADYRYGESVYITLSLLSKSLLAWLVFGGTFQPNGSN
jgi:hypothetical protein